jgi:Ca-activated chloride channel family protein
MKAGSASAWLWAVGIGLVSGCHSLDEKSSSDFPQASGTEANFSGDRAGSNHNASNGGSSDLAEEAVREPATEADPNAVVTNPFVTTETDPFSTFAADVDTASYDIYRRSVLGGVLPTPSEVRVEEFVNYFTYAYAAPSLDAEAPFTISLAASAHPLDAPTTLLRVGIQGAMPTTRSAANLVFLVDVSGSMDAPNKLPLVRELLEEALSVLQPSDKVSIVSYASDSRVRLSPTPVSDAKTIRAQIEQLYASGGTNGGSGITLAYAEARKAFLEEGINHVILCTDGDFNLGVTSDDALVALIEKERRDGITLTALGFGSRNNDAMMERVSNAGNGIYSVIYSEDQALQYAHRRMLSSMIHIAQDMKIQVEFNPELVHAYRLLGYENRAVADDDFRNDSVDGGEVGAGHRVTALYELALTQADLPTGEGIPAVSEGEKSSLTPEIGAGELVRVKVRYEAPGSGDNGAAEEVVSSLAPGALIADVSKADADTRWAVGVATFAEVLRNSPYVPAERVSELRSLFADQAQADGERVEWLTLFDAAVKLLAP